MFGTFGKRSSLVGVLVVEPISTFEPLEGVRDDAGEGAPDEDAWKEGQGRVYTQVHFETCVL